MSRNSFVLLLAIVALVALLFFVFSPGKEKVQNISVSEFLSRAKAGEITEITKKGDTLKLTTTGGQELECIIGENTSLPELLDLLDREGVKVGEGGVIVQEEKVSRFSRDWLLVMVNFVPLLLFGALLFFLLQRAPGPNQALSFGRSRARMFTGNRPTVTFKDVAGVEEAKQELQEIVEFLKNPEKFTSLGARIPRGVLLVGPPGTGKTLLSKAVAGEAGVPFFSISGSEFVEMFVGVGAARVRDLFDQAKRNAPSIIFVDEIDAVGRHRGAGIGGGHDEREQTLNQILAEMDGFDTNTNVIVISATNRPDILDPALLRPGRFDRRVVLDPPDLNGREAILEVHTRGKPLGENVDLMVLAKQTPGFSGADLANLVNEAAILAARRGKKVIEMEEFEEAIERVIAGPERKTRVISQEEKRITAYHEAGHALVMHHLPHCDPVHKVSIIARGVALGYTLPLPGEDRYLRSRSKFKDELAGLLAGRAAEELVFNDVTTGAANDLEQATKLARRMVTEYGMSEKLGPRTFGKREELIFLGKEIAEQRDYSEKIALQIDEEVHQLIEEAYQTAQDILKKYRPNLDRLAEELITRETIEGEELKALLEAPPQKKKVSRRKPRGGGRIRTAE